MLPRAMGATKETLWLRRQPLTCIDQQPVEVLSAWSDRQKDCTTPWLVTLAVPRFDGKDQESVGSSQSARKVAARLGRTWVPTHKVPGFGYADVAVLNDSTPWNLSSQISWMSTSVRQQTRRSFIGG